MNIMRNIITTRAMMRNGVYCLTPSLIWAPERRNSSDSKMKIISQEYSMSSPIAIIRKLLVMKFCTMPTEIMKMMNPQASSSTGCLRR